jgi:hypothetical protein
MHSPEMLSGRASKNIKLFIMVFFVEFKEQGDSIKSILMSH